MVPSAIITMCMDFHWIRYGCILYRQYVIIMIMYMRLTKVLY